MGTGLAGTGQVTPTYWLNPKNGVSYPSSSRLRNTGSTAQRRCRTCRSIAAASGTQILGGVASFERATTNAVVSQYDIQPMVQILTTTEGRISAPLPPTFRRSSMIQADLPKGATVVLLGQVTDDE